MKGERKRLRETQPFWGTRELSLNPEEVCMAMLDGLPVWAPGLAMEPLIAFSRKAHLYSRLCRLLQDACEKRGAGRAVELAETRRKCLWAHAEAPVVETPQTWAVDLSSLIAFGGEEEWFTDPPHLGRVILHQLVEMPDRHVLLLLSPVEIGGTVGHLMGLAYISCEKRLKTYAAGG